MAATKKIPADVLGVLASMDVTSDSNPNFHFLARITEGQLPRDLYVALDKVLKAMGGKWNRSAKGHIFDIDPSEAIELASLTGEYTDKKQALQFFETPEALAEELVAAAEIKNEHRVLEPSAGRGRIVRAIFQSVPDSLVYAMELDHINFMHLAKIELLYSNFAPLNGDFMAEGSGFFSDNLHTVRMQFDRVVANPPFSKRQDVDHITRAFSMLRAGGRLVSVMSASAPHRIDKKGLAFKSLIEDCGRYYDLPEGTFKESGTNVRASVVVLNKQ